MEPELVLTSVKTFAPATIANLGLGFDFLDYTVDGLGIGAMSPMKMLGIRSVGLSLSLDKGLPLGSGLGSSAESAASVVVVVNEIFGAVLLTEIEMSHVIWNCSQAGALVAFVMQEVVKKVAIDAGAFGCTINGAEPTVVAVTNDEKGKEIGYQMVVGFINDGGSKASAMIRRVDQIGARVIS
ncbi:hypothetical protein NE237_004861 [Protea cynaroides]|uniref:GHMP kinase N-terminal domain-containing protein n=1 Tax=Protea cynaroides TaxID=273540 RepID=A0A9Q0KJN3_9MAGN|nr:hypothetical protein NE237_004861 [Protea cynaroides]